MAKKVLERKRRKRLMWRSRTCRERVFVEVDGAAFNIIYELFGKPVLAKLTDVVYSWGDG